MRTSVHDSVTPLSGPPRFQHYWLAETVRLRESQWGPLQDSNEIRRARAHDGKFARRLLLRACLLGQREGIDAVIQKWSGAAKLALAALLVLAALTGMAAALGALGDGTHQVNLILTLTALLGLNTLTFVFWLFSSMIPLGSTHASLGELWLWLTRKLVRGPQGALVPRALVGLLARQGALRPLLGSISHVLWLLALVAMLITLLALLSARRYTFGWETTLLSPDTFVWFTKGLGWLPSLLGFNVPPEAVIRASDGLHALPETAHAAWSGWLIGCLICYGVLPRLLALVITTVTTRKRIRALDLDTRLPGYIELRDRLDPASVTGGIDAPAPAEFAVRPLAHHLVPRDRPQAIAGLELADDTSWPPAGLAPHVADLGVIDNRVQRQHLLDALHLSPPDKLLIVCDGHQTPDRGILTLISELAGLARQTRVLILTDPDVAAFAALATSGRMSLWQDHLQKSGLATDAIYQDLTRALTWLNTSAVDASPEESLS